MLRGDWSPLSPTHTATGQSRPLPCIQNPNSRIKCFVPGAIGKLGQWTPLDPVPGQPHLHGHPTLYDHLSGPDPRSSHPVGPATSCCPKQTPNLQLPPQVFSTIRWWARWDPLPMGPPPLGFPPVPQPDVGTRSLIRPVKGSHKDPPLKTVPFPSNTPPLLQAVG